MNFEYPLYVDENIIQPLAITIFITSIIILLEPTLSFLVYFLFLDFLLRYINPLFSPHTHFHKIIIYSLLKIKDKPKKKLSGPNRFSILIGVLIMGLTSIALLLDFKIGLYIFLIMMIIASGLQGIYNYCLGCVMYNYLISSGLIKSNLKSDNIKKAV